MAKLDAHQRTDKKRTDGNFKPQGKKGAKKPAVKTGGHKNKYEQFSQAANAMARLEASREADRIRTEREAHEQRMGWRRY